MNAAWWAARELIGPIIAMTINSRPPFYTPIALQGGLTGAPLSRIRAHSGRAQFFISGVVALVCRR